jgi:hypothetical protein
MILILQFVTILLPFSFAFFSFLYVFFFHLFPSFLLYLSLNVGCSKFYRIAFGWSK